MPLALLLLGLSGCGGGGGGAPSVTAAPDTYLVNPGGTITIPVPGVLQNDTGSGLTAELVSYSGLPSTLTLNSNGSFTYTQNAAASFVYRAVNGTGSATATVTIGINQPPVASNVCPAIQDNASAVGVTLPATDPNGNGTIASFTIDSLPSNGSITGCPGVPCPVGLNVTYVPTPNLTGKRGMDKFTFHATDSNGLVSATATAWVLNNGKVRIMPLGDSITAGVTLGGVTCGGDDCPLSVDRVGYRLDLFNSLKTLSAGEYDIDFVGGQFDGSNFIASDGFDINHEGHPGWCDDDNPICFTTGGSIADNINGFLINNPADIILLHIGTNTFDVSSAGVNTILGNISTWAGSNYPVNVFVARIIPTVDGSKDVQAFNTNVMAIATDRPRVKVFKVDQQNELHKADDLTGNLAEPTFMTDNLHPNSTGYTRMANRWLANLVSAGVLPSCP